MRICAAPSMSYFGKSGLHTGPGRRHQSQPGIVASGSQIRTPALLSQVETLIRIIGRPLYSSGIFNRLDARPIQLLFLNSQMCPWQPHPSASDHWSTRREVLADSVARRQYFVAAESTIDAAIRLSISPDLGNRAQRYICFRNLGNLLWIRQFVSVTYATVMEQCRSQIHICKALDSAYNAPTTGPVGSLEFPVDC